MELFTDCSKDSKPVDGQTTETKQKGALDLGNMLNTFKVCTKVGDTTDYQMIDTTTCSDGNTLKWTLYTDETCTTKKSTEDPDPNEKDLNLDGTICNSEFDKTFKMTKKNGKRDPVP